MKELRSIKLDIERFLREKIKLLEKPEHKTSEVPFRTKLISIRSFRFNYFI